MEALRQLSPKGQLRFLFSDSLVFGVISVLERMAAIFVLPVLVRIFSRAEYGVVDAVRVFGATIAIVAIVGLDQATARFIAQYVEVDKKKDTAGEGLRLSLICSLIVSAAVFAMARPAASLLMETMDERVVVAIRFIALATPFRTVVQFAQMLLKWHFRRTHFMALSFFYTGVEIILMLLAVLWLRAGIPGLFAAQAIASAAAAVLALYFTRDLFNIFGSGGGAVSYFSYAVPLAATASVSSFLPLVERGLLIRLFGIELLAVYSVAQSLCRLITLPSTGFLVAWNPFAFSLYHEDRKDWSVFNQCLLWFTVIACLIFLVSVFLAKPALTLLASAKYVSSTVLVAPIAFALFAETAVSVTAINISLTKRTYLYLVPYAGQIFVLAVAAYLLRGWGIFGFSLAYLVAKLFLLCSGTVIAAKLPGVQYAFARPGIIALAALLMGISWWGPR